MTQLFDLLTEPWIPVVERSDETRWVGVREALHRAPELIGIRDEMPILEFGVLRFLTAVVLDVFRPTRRSDLEDLLEAGGFPDASLDAYLQAHASRFRLFDPAHPFLQSADLVDAEKKPVALLDPAIPSGTNASHFHRHREEEFGVCPAVAARLLTSIPVFQTMGGAGLSPSINGAPPWYAVVAMPTLFETLVVNAYWRPTPQVSELGIPAWRRQGQQPAGKQKEAGRLEAMTWQPRRVLLHAGDAGVCSITGQRSPTIVRDMAFVAGVGVDSDFDWADDPNVAYKAGSTGLFPLRPSEGREVWRDTGPLALSRSNERGKDVEVAQRPRVVDHYAELAEGDVLRCNEQFRLHLYGMRTDLKTKVFEWFRERLELPDALVWQSPLFNQAWEALKDGEEVSSLLRGALKRAYPRQGKGNKSAFDTLIDTTRAAYWREIQPEYEALLRALAEPAITADPQQQDAVRRAWRERLRKVGASLLEAALDPLDADFRALYRCHQARGLFHGGWCRKFDETATRTKKRSAKQPAGSAPTMTAHPTEGSPNHD